MVLPLLLGLLAFVVIIGVGVLIFSHVQMIAFDQTTLESMFNLVKF
jgi:hypothetical protein